MYSYENEKPKLFTEENQILFIKMREQVHNMLRTSGAFKLEKAIHLPSGIGAADSWTMMACVDRLEELGEIRFLGQSSAATQDKVYVKGN